MYNFAKSEGGQQETTNYTNLTKTKISVESVESV